MTNRVITLAQFIIILYLVTEISSKFEFTNLKCNNFDKAFSDFEYCYIKAINQSYKYISIKTKLFQIPVTKVKINLMLFKRYNGYRPFMFNVTADACRFIRHVNSNPVLKYYYRFIELYSNMNHQCPFDHDLEFEKLPISFVNDYVTKVLPFPDGDYMLETNWFAYDIKRASVKIYGTIS